MANAIINEKSPAAIQAGQRAEKRVFDALDRLPAPWKTFYTVEWRYLNHYGEVVGEADAVVFHPHWGVVVFEIKAGTVSVHGGQWYYASGQPMKQAPSEQARRNRYALIEKLTHRLKHDVENLTVTHAVWFPDVIWQGPVPDADFPSREFLLDRSALAEPEAALLKIFREASPQPQAWTIGQQQALKIILAPDCQQFVPLGVHVEDALQQLQSATEQQVQILRMLRNQSRLLVEGGAGTGKTMLACALARDHASQGRKVLLTCFNATLAQYLASCLHNEPNLTVSSFHHLAHKFTQEAGLPYDVPEGGAAQAERVQFFNEKSPELLIKAREQLGVHFDTVIVDEATDFSVTWWVALAELGKPDKPDEPGFSWYCFFDRNQNLFRQDQKWEPPFPGQPMVLDTNLRNTRQIGELAARMGGISTPQTFRVDVGVAPQFIISPDFAQMAVQLRKLLHNLLGAQQLKPEQIVVLSPYKHTSPAATWAAGLDRTPTVSDMVSGAPGCVRVGTVQGFKGMESDVVVLVGLDARTALHRENLYVGASRARSALYVLALKDAGLG